MRISCISTRVRSALPYLTQPHQSLLRWYVDDVIVGGARSGQRTTSSWCRTGLGPASSSIETSSLSVTAIGEVIGTPERTVGTH